MKIILILFGLVLLTFSSIAQMTGGAGKQENKKEISAQNKYSVTYLNVLIGLVSTEESLSSSSLTFSDEYSIYGLSLGRSFKFYRINNFIAGGRSSVITNYNGDGLDVDLELGFNAAFALPDNDYIELGYAVIPSFQFDNEIFFIKNGPYFRYRFGSLLLSLDYTFGSYQEEYWTTQYDPNTGNLITFYEQLDKSINAITLGIGLVL